MAAAKKPFIYMPRSTKLTEPLGLASGGACGSGGGGGGEDAQKSFWLVPTERVLAFASKRLTLGDSHPLPPPLDTLPPGTVEGTHHGRLEELLVRRLALHRSCTNRSDRAAVCIVSAPSSGRCYDWESLCPGRRLAVIGFFDPDLVFYKGNFPNFCRTLWGCEATRPGTCADAACPAARIVRIAANQPLLVQRFACGFAPTGTISVPYLGHARTPVALAGRASDAPPPATSSPTARPVHVAMAIGRYSHKSMTALGFRPWRDALVAECRARAARDNSTCHDFYPLPNGANALHAVAWYARATFCLQPPGDTVARAAIADAVSVGCIPVLLHPAQLRLWPWHWDASSASVFENFTNVGARNASWADAARGLFHRLLRMPRAKVRALQRAVRAAAPRLVYGGEGAAGADDAVEALVQGLLGGRATPADAPPAEWSTTLYGDAVESDSLQPTRPAKPHAKPSGRPPNKAKPSAKAAGRATRRGRGKRG